MREARVPVSVLITTYNEELNIEDCLRSVTPWAEEVFVVDSFSTDRTCLICEGYGVKIYQAPSQRIADLKNWALDSLPFGTDWVLILDADERVTPELREEIAAILEERPGACDGYYVNRRFIFYGKWIRHCGWYPSWNLRLFRHKLGRYEDRAAHEHVILNGRVGYCGHDLLHEDRRDLDFWIAKHNRYATHEAHEHDRLLKGARDTGFTPSFFKGSVERKRALKERVWVRLPGRALLRFIYLYVFRLGFLDGGHGFKFCVMHAIFEHFVTMKLWELRHYKTGAPRGGISTPSIFERVSPGKTGAVSDMPGRNRRRIIRGAVFIALVVSLFEGGGRLAIHLRYGVPGKSYGLWISDPELGAIHQPNGYNTLTALNGYGLRNREDVVEPKPANSIRVVAFGGSTTFGYNLTDEETYTERLQSKLRKVPNYERSEVLNAGAIMYSAGHNMILMKRLIPKLKPDYAIIYEGINEYGNMLALRHDGVRLDDLNGRYRVIGKGWYDQNRWLKRNSILVRVVAYFIINSLAETIRRKMGVGDQRDVAIHPWVFKNYEFILGEMIAFLRRQNVDAIVIRYAVMPARYGPWRNEYLKVFADISDRVAREKRVPVYDMAERFRGLAERQERYFIDTGVHVTAEGAEVLGSDLCAIIMRRENEKQMLPWGSRGRSRVDECK